MPELTPEQRAQLDRNIKMMLNNGASESDVMTYASDFRIKYDVKKKDGLPVSSIGGGVFPLLYERQKTSSIPATSLSAHQLSSENKLVVPKIKAYKELTDKEAEVEAANEISEVVSSSISDDPLGDAFKHTNETKYISSGDTNDEETFNLKLLTAKLKILNNAFGTAQNATNYLQSQTPGLNVATAPTEQLNELAGDNFTKKAAVKRIQDLRNVERDFDYGKRTLEDAAIHHAINNGDEQVAYLFEKAGGSAGIPPSMKGEKVLQFVMNPNVQELAEQYPALKQELNETIANFPNHHPESAVKILSQLIAGKRDEKGLNNSFANIIGKESTDKLVDELIEEGSLPPNYRFVYERLVRPKLGTAQSIGRGIGNIIPGLNQLVNQSPIPTPGLLENIEEGLENIQVGTAKSIAGITGISGLIQPKAQRLYNTLEGQYSTPEFEPSSLLHQATLHGGQMFSFVAGLVGGSAALKATNLIKSPVVAQGTMMVLATHGDSRDKAISLFPRNPIKQAVYTTTMDGLNAVMGKFLPGKNIPKLLSKGEQTIANSLRAMVDGNITTDAAKSKILNFAANTLKTTLSGAEFMGALAATDDLLTQGLQGKGIDFSQTLDSGWEAFKLGAVSSVFLGVAEASLKVNKGLRSEILSIAANPEHYKKLLEKEAESNPELAKIKDDIIGNIDHIGKVYAETKLTGKDKEQFVLNSLAEKVKLNQAENTTDPTIKKRYQQEAKNIGEIKEGALNGIPEEKIRENQAIKEVKQMYNNGYLTKAANELLESKTTEESEGKFDDGKVKSFLKQVAENPDNKYPLRVRELADEMFPEYKKAAEDKAEQESTNVTPVEKGRKSTSVIMPSGNKSPEVVPLKKAGEVWFRGVKGDKTSGDTFYSSDEGTATDFGVTKAGDKPNVTQLDKKEHPKNPLVVGTKEDLAETIGFPEQDIYDLKGGFDQKAKEYAQSKGHDAIIYESGTFDKRELHLFEKDMRAMFGKQTTTGTKVTGVAYHGDTGKDNQSGKAVYLGSKKLAEDYNEGKGVTEYEYELSNPLVVKTDKDFEPVKQIIDSYRKKNPNARWHPDITDHVNAELKKKGHDGLIIEEDALESEKGYTEIGGTYGEAQVVVFDTKNVKKKSNEQTTTKEGDKPGELMTNEKGEPTTFYHGTNRKGISELEPSTARQLGKGIYFGSSKTDAIGDLGDKGQIFEVHLPKNLIDAGGTEYGKIQKEISDKSGEDWDSHKFPIEEVNAEVKKRGYKGVIMDNAEYGGKEVMIFNKKDIVYKNKSKEQTTTKEGGKEDPLVDVESTTKALEKIDKKELNKLSEFQYKITDEQAKKELIREEEDGLKMWDKANAHKGEGYREHKETLDRYKRGLFTEEEIQIGRNLLVGKKIISSDSPSKPFGHNKNISEAYHKAKSDNSNPELVKAVEDAVKSKTNEQTTKESNKPSEPISPKKEVLADAEPNKAGEPTKEGAGGEKPPISEPPKSGKIFVEYPATELSHKGLQKVANEFSLSDIEVRDRKSDLKLKTDAQATANEWAEKGVYSRNVEKLVEKAEDGEILTDEQRVILEQHLANVSNELRSIKKDSPEFDAKLAEIKRLKDAGEKTRSEAGAALRIPIGGSRPKTIVDFLVEEMDAAGVDKLTEKQKETSAKEYEDITEAKAKFDEYVAQKEAELAQKMAAASFEKQKSATKKGQKKDFKKERDEIFTSIRDKLRSARGDTSATIVPYAKELFAIAPDVAKLVKSYVEQGVTELSEIIKKVHSDLKEDIKDIQEKDIRDLVAGVYNEKKKTRSELAARLMDLKVEANLINKLEALESGEVPKSEKKKIERNKQISELRQKIKPFTELQAKKEKMSSEIKEIKEQIKTGNFEKQAVVKKSLPLDKEGNDLRSNLIKLRQAREFRLLLQQRRKEGRGERALRLTAEVANIPRTLMTILDFSALLRQNLFFSVGHPLMTSKALPGMFKSFTNKEVYDNWFADVQESPRYPGMKDSRLAIADPLSHDLSKHEEAFMSTLAEKIPIIGQSLEVNGKTVVPGVNVVKGSERSYTYVLNKLRLDMYNFFADSMEQRGLTIANNLKVYKAMAEYINNATGRSDFGKTLNRVAPILNSVFFSPRLITSRINMLTYWAQPRFWKTLPREVRVDYFRNWISLLAVGGSVLALAKLAGADVEDDPRSSDFGKIKSGNTRWDIWGGAQPYIRVVAQVASGERKSTNTGKIYSLSGDDIFGETKTGVVADFFRNKLAPVPGAAVDLLSGRTGVGDKIVYQWGDAGDKEIAINHYIKQRILPMTITGTAEAMKDSGVKALFTVGIPSIFGVGTQTYKKPPPTSKKTKSTKSLKSSKSEK